MFINNDNVPWWAPRNYGPFRRKDYIPAFPKKDWWEAKPPGWDTRSWDDLVRSINDRPEIPELPKEYKCDGHTFETEIEFKEYLIKRKKRDEIVDRLLDPYENKVQDDIVCGCGSSLELFAIPYKIVNFSNVYKGYIYIEFCEKCDDFAEKCTKGKEAYLALIKKSISNS